SRIDAIIEECRDTVGHVRLAETYPCAVEDLMLGMAPACVAFGPGMQIGEIIDGALRLQTEHPQTGCFVFLESRAMTIDALCSLQSVTSDIFSFDDPPARLVHALLSLARSVRGDGHRNLITVSGAKGGVGTTTLACAIAHALDLQEHRSVLVDLSATSFIARALLSPHLSSQELGGALADDSPLDAAVIRSAISTAPCGLDHLLPPAGGAHIRESWIRDTQRFERTLTAIELLQELYDAVVIDIAGCEGIVPFALQSRADIRISVCTGDPAAVHVHGVERARFGSMEGEGVTVFIPTSHGISTSDFERFVANSLDSGEAQSIVSLPRDNAGATWIGSGDTFYGRSSRASRRVIDQLAEVATRSREPSDVDQSKADRHTSPVGPRLALPMPSPVPNLLTELFSRISKFRPRLTALERVPRRNPFRSPSEMLGDPRGSAT
ncbi:MAG: ParA family protein, partial [Deltaproteobacteria bacterium]|nr:ParA family protein [Deltaproteobacteria bacterium]